jgi:hypothetical protein
VGRTGWERQVFKSVKQKKRRKKDTWLTGQDASILILLYLKKRVWWRGGGKASPLPTVFTSPFFGKYLET